MKTYQNFSLLFEWKSILETTLEFDLVHVLKFGLNYERKIERYLEKEKLHSPFLSWPSRSQAEWPISSSFPSFLISLSALLPSLWPSHAGRPTASSSCSAQQLAWPSSFPCVGRAGPVHPILLPWRSVQFPYSRLAQ